jgi:class 3 adenylate cyclase/tetratricopeptide (TPR) repeat protein
VEEWGGTGVICSTCGTENEAGRKFCMECAAPLAMACPNCGTPNPPNAKFCGECAAPLTAGDGSVAPSAAVESASTRPAERRLVSVLFADLVGFTTFSEARDAEEVRDLLSRWYELASGVIARYGGTVEKFIGDAVMAVWGTPIAHEDDAERAVRAGLEVVDAVRAIGEGIEARGGVLTGEAAVRATTNEGLVVGDMVNTAARLQSVAPPGSVLVGEATYRAASRAITFEEVGEQLLKGKAIPVPAWRALQVVAERGGRNRPETLEPPFVGRQDELRLVKDLFHATGREGRIRLVSVMGPGGIGKSRLAREFSKYSDGLVEDVYYHAGRCPSYGDGITFWALGEMIRGRCGLLETDDEATTREKVAHAVAEWVTDEAERTWIEPALLTLLGIESGASSDDLFAAWRTFFERISTRGTVVLVFEDFHLADRGLLDFVDHLLEWSRGHPIYVITLSRPELLEKRPDWGAGKRNFVSLALEPLSADAMHELLSGLVPGLAAPIARQIVARADGIPLYAVETVRMLLADGRLHPEGDGYAVAGDLAQIAVPETLVALIGARLDALDASDRRLLQDAAVLGQSFTVAALAAVAGIGEAELEPRLTSLARREFLTRDADPRSPEHGQYAFVQALVREVAYSTLAKGERKVRHLATARHFEALGTDELAGALARHYLAAHDNAADGAEANALAAQARIALKAAADRAASLGAYDDAVASLELALTVTTDPAEQADVLERTGDAARIAGRYADGADLERRALAIRRELGDAIGAARVTVVLAEALLDGVKDFEAVELLESAVAEFDVLSPDPIVASLGALLARAKQSAGDFKGAVAAAERVLETAEPRNLMPVVTRALIAKGSALGSLGRKREGIALLKAAEQLARDHGLHSELLGALMVGSFTLIDLDEIAALEGFRAGLSLATRLGRRNIARRFANNVGYTAFLVGEWDEALAVMEGALTDDLAPSDRLVLLGNALIVRAARGESISDGIAEMESLGQNFADDPRWRAPMYDPMGNAALAEGRLDAARRAWVGLADLEHDQITEFRYRASHPAVWSGDVAALRDDLAAIDATGIHGLVVDARRTTIQAGIAALEGRASEAISLYRDAIQRWRDTGQPWDEALTIIDVATTLGTADADIRRAAEQSREFLARVGAMPFLERLDAAMERQTPADPVIALGKPAPTPRTAEPEKKATTGG